MKDNDILVNHLEEFAHKMRRRILEASANCEGPVHIGGALSMVEIMAVLYGHLLTFDPKDTLSDKRDRFILSKGHGVLGFYPALVEAGLISEETFSTFKTNGSDLISHPVMKMSYGIESSNGSLGQGLSMAVGLGWAAKHKSQKHKVYVLLGDGECNEGSVWEAAMAASQFSLDNVVAIVDANGLQSDGKSGDVMTLEPLHDKWVSFGWAVYDVDGHSIPELLLALKAKNSENKPKLILARTIKGKGISFMEGNNSWHHNRLTRQKFEEAMLEIGLV